MNWNQVIRLVIGAGAMLATAVHAEQRRDLWGQGRVEVVIGGGNAGGPCYDCDGRRGPGGDRYPAEAYEDRGQYGDRDGGFQGDRERWKDRAEARREWEKARQEAMRERAKDRREFERERAKAEREAWKEEEKSRREWAKEREKAEREAWKERYKR
jgi:hypothetical protein